MPYTDDEGERVDNGETATAERTITFDSAGTNTQTIVMAELTAVTEVVGATTNAAGQVDEANNEAVEVSEGAGANEVDVTFYVPDGAGALVAGTPAADRDVTITAKGY